MFEKKRRVGYSLREVKGCFCICSKATNETSRMLYQTSIGKVQSFQPEETFQRPLEVEPTTEAH